MSKKRRTKEQKIIAKLRRQLNQNQSGSLKVADIQKSADMKTENFDNNSTTNKKLTQVEQKRPQFTKKSTNQVRSHKELLFTYDPKLIKKSLIKTSVLSFAFFGLIILLYYLIEVKNILPL